MLDDSEWPKNDTEAAQGGNFMSKVRGHDRVLLVFFSICVVLMVLLVVISYPPLAILVPLLGGMLAVFFMTGLPAAVFYWKKGTVSTAWLLLALVILSLAYMGGLYAGHGSEKLPAPFDSYGVGGELAFFYLFALVVLLLYVFVGFGMMWLLSFAQRMSLPDSFGDIKAMTAHDTGDGPSWRSEHFWKALVLGAVFNIPDHLDSGTLYLKPGKKRKQFPWHELIRAFGWTMVFGVFIIMLIALNPFLKELPAFQNIFDISAFISFFVPLLVIPWFIFKRLDVRIKGPVKDFRLYKGLRSRITRSVLALSTLIIFIRMALPTLSLKETLWEFFQLFMDFTAVVIITTFVYFNYFEEDVAEEVARDWKR
jgi:hypothetical protein